MLAHYSLVVEPMVFTKLTGDDTRQTYVSLYGGIYTLCKVVVIPSSSSSSWAFSNPLLDIGLLQYLPLFPVFALPHPVSTSGHTERRLYAVEY